MKENFLEHTLFMKTILMILVVLGHACAFWSGNWFTRNPILPSIGLKLIYTYVTSFHIYAFTFISGYIFAYKYETGSYSSLKQLLVNKAKRLLVPYAFVAAIWVVPITVVTMDLNTKDVFWNYILCTQPSQLWFLWMLFDTFVIMWLLRGILTKNTSSGWVVIVFLYILGLIGKSFIPNFFCIWESCEFIPTFYMGMSVFRSKCNKEPWYMEKYSSPIIVLRNIILFVCFLICGRFDGVIAEVLSISIGFFLHLDGASMAVIVLQRIAEKCRWEKAKIVNILIPHTMTIYLFHQQIIYFVIIILNGKVNPVLNAAVNFFSAIAISLGISIFLSHWKSTSILIGQR